MTEYRLTSTTNVVTVAELKARNNVGKKGSITILLLHFDRVAVSIFRGIKTLTAVYK